MAQNFHIQKQNVNKKLTELSKSPVKTCNLHQEKRQNSLVLKLKKLIQMSDTELNMDLLNACMQTVICKRIINGKKDLNILDPCI